MGGLCLYPPLFRREKEGIMYRKIGIIGLGSLGSHIAYDMAERKETNEIKILYHQ